MRRIVRSRRRLSKGVRSRGAPKKGYIRNMSTGQTRSFLLNPSSVSESQNPSFSTIDGIGGGYPLVEYSTSGTNVVSTEIYLRGTASEVWNFISWYKKLLPKKSRRVMYSPPPKVKMALGRVVVKGVISSSTIKYTEFDKYLKPTEATISCKITEVV